MQIKFYCDCCDKHQPVELEPLKNDNLNESPWGDVVCKVCSFVIATYSAAEEGELVCISNTEAAQLRVNSDSAKGCAKYEYCECGHCSKICQCK